MTTGKTIALTRRTFVGKVMSLLFNMPSRLVITFLPRSKSLISWLQSQSTVILEPKKGNLSLLLHFPLLFASNWWDQMPWSSPHSGTLAWKIPWMEEPGRLQSMGSLRVRHNFTFTFMHWRGKCQSTPVFLPGESQGWGSLVGCRLWGRTESDTTEVI